MTVKPILDFRLKLEIELKDQVEGITIADVFGDNTKGLDMSFVIDKSYTNEPTESVITIYNLATNTYNIIYEKANAFRLSCARGEEEDYVPFYTGFPIRSTKVAKETVLTSNQGFMAQDANAGRAGQNDLETVIKLRNYGFAQLFKSYQDNVSAEFVIQDCINAIGLPKGNIDKNIEENIKKVILPKGFTIRGEVQKTLTLLGERCGFNWNVNDMKLNLYDKNRSDYKTYGILLTPDNSATPERQDDKFKARTKSIQKASKKKGIKGVKATSIIKEDRGFKIRTALLPHLVVGSTCYLSEDFGISGASGDKYIYRITLVGSNVGTEGYSEIYCV
jgi:hypothetical protein